MSAALQQIPGKRHEVSDDLESILQLLRWCGLKYLPHYWSDHPAQLRTLLETFDFHVEDPVTGFSKGHREKLDLICGGGCCIPGLHPNLSFAILLETLLLLFRKHYELLGFNPPHPPSPPRDETELLYAAQRAAMQFAAHFPPGVLPAFLPAPPAITITDIAKVAAKDSGATGRTEGVSTWRYKPKKVPPTPKESPLYDHNQFMTIMCHVLSDRQYQLEWGKLKNVKHASSFTRDTASTAGSKPTLYITDSIDRPRKKART